MRRGTPHSFVLFAAPNGWRVVAINGAPDSPDARTAADVAPADDAALLVENLIAAIRADGPRGAEVVVALPADACFAATIPTEGLPRRGRRAAMLYRFEEQLPLAAEDLSADFVAHNGSALAVCTQAQPLAQIVEALEDRGVRVAAVCPQALLALQALRARPELAAALTCDALLWQHDANVAVITLAEGQPTAWHTVPAEPADTAYLLATRILRAGAPLRLAAISLDPMLLAHVETMADVEVAHRGEMSLDEATILASRRILSGRQAAPVDMRDAGRPAGRARRVRRPALVSALAAVVVLCVCLLAAMIWRADRYARLAGQAQIEREAIFHRLFPAEPVPVGIASRLRSVQSQSRRDGAGDASPANRPDVLPVLRDVLAHLPADARFRIAEMDVEGDRLTLRGEVRAHGDADAIAAALRAGLRMDVDEPQTQQLASGVVQFSIAASRPTPSGGQRSQP